jgi:hypothetical protein
MHPAAIWRGAKSWRWARNAIAWLVSARLTTGYGTGGDWYGCYAMAMASIALVLHKSGQRPGTDPMMKFLEHFAAIRAALDDLGLWDDEDGISSGRHMTLDAIAADLSDRLISLFACGADEKRPCFGGTEILQSDPAWRDNLFSEYFNGDDGAGLGASLQTGWNGLIADLVRRKHGDVRT